MDRETIINGLEIILNGCNGIRCEDCIFRIKEPAKPAKCGMDEEQIEEAAIAMLKEQKAVEPDTNSAGTCTCGTCGETVGYYPAGCNIPRKLCKFCPECGRAVKLE